MVFVSFDRPRVQAYVPMAYQPMQASPTTTVKNCDDVYFGGINPNIQRITIANLPALPARLSDDRYRFQKTETVANWLERFVRRGIARQTNPLTNFHFLPDERSLATHTGLSTVAMNTANSILEAKGLVEGVPGQGYRIVANANRPAEFQQTKANRALVVAKQMLDYMRDGNMQPGDSFMGIEAAAAEFGTNNRVAWQAMRVLVSLDVLNQANRRRNGRSGEWTVNDTSATNTGVLDQTGARQLTLTERLRARLDSYVNRLRRGRNLPSLRRLLARFDGAKTATLMAAIDGAVTDGKIERLPNRGGFRKPN